LDSHVQIPKQDRALTGLFGLVLGLSLVTSLIASLYARGLYGDGVYYLWRVSAGQWFHNVDPPRATVNVLRQVPIVLLTRYSDMSVFERGQAFTFVMLMLPPALCAICWWIAPANRKGWIVFPLLSLTAAFSTTSFFANGEPSTGTSYWWCLMFLLMYSTRDSVSRLLFLALCIPAFQLQEGIFPLMLVLLIAPVVRLLQAEGRQDQVFSAIALVLIVSIISYELRWVIYPRIPPNRESILHSLAHFDYLWFDGHLNLPAISGIVALVALCGVMWVQWRLPDSRAQLRSRQIAICFCAFCVAAAAGSLLVEASFSPGGQAAARYNPVFLSFALGLVMLGFDYWKVPERIWFQPAALAIIAALSVAQATADIAASMRWRAYVTDLQTRLATSRGLIHWDDTVNTGDAVKDTNWRLMSVQWVIPLISIAFAKNGMVTTMISAGPSVGFRPIEASRPDQFPALRGVDFSPFRAALAGS